MHTRRNIPHVTIVPEVCPGAATKSRRGRDVKDCAAYDQRAFTGTGAVGAVGGWQMDEESGMVRLTRTEHASNTRSVEAQVGIVHRRATLLRRIFDGAGRRRCQSS